MLVGLALAGPGPAQATWGKRYVDAASDVKLHAVAVDASGNRIAAGYLDGKALLLKLNSSGSIVWQRRILLANERGSYGLAAAVGQYCYVVAGYAWQESGYTAGLIAAVDRNSGNGQVLSEGDDNIDHEFHAVTIHHESDNDYAIAVGVSRKLGNNDFWVAKYKLDEECNLDLQWHRLYHLTDLQGTNMNYPEEATAVQILTGTSPVEVGVLGQYVTSGTGIDTWLLRLDFSNGTVRGSYPLVMPGEDYATSLAWDGTSQLIIGGSTDSWSPTSNLDFFAIRLVVNTGEVVWQYAYNLAPKRSYAQDYGYALIPLSDGSGSFLLAGYSVFWNLSSWDEDASLLKLGSNGTPVWYAARGRSGTEDEKLFAAAATANGAFVTAGDYQNGALDEGMVLDMDSGGRFTNDACVVLTEPFYQQREIDACYAWLDAAGKSASFKSEDERFETPLLTATSVCP